MIKGTNDQYRTTHPTSAELVIEVCVTSHEYDRSKLRAYAQRELFLVASQGIERFLQFTDAGTRFVLGIWRIR